MNMSALDRAVQSAGSQQAHAQLLGIKPPSVSGWYDRCAARHSERAKLHLFLRKNGIKHYLDAHDWPVVLRSSAEGTAHTPKAPPTWTSSKVA